MEDLIQKLLKRPEWQAKISRANLYKEFLASDEWKERRALVYERAKGECERCHHSHPMMNCHHLSYDFPNVPIDAPWPEGWLPEITALCLLCVECHEFLHKKSFFDPCNN